MVKYPSVNELAGVSTPGLWVDRATVQINIDQMITDVGGFDELRRLRPHVKTHKMPEVIKMLVASGITKCKASTPKEAQIAAENGATDILIAHQLVGAKLDEVARLVTDFPLVCFSSIVDDEHALLAIAAKLGNTERPFMLRIDVDCGMQRSGIPFGDGLRDLRRKIESTEGLIFSGLHIYDGHINEPTLATRTREGRGSHPIGAELPL